MFKVDSTAPGREYGTIYLGDKNIAYLVVANGFAKVIWSFTLYCFYDLLIFYFMYHLIPNAILVDQVKEQGRRKGDNNPYTTELLRLEEKAKDQGLGCWSKVSIWDLITKRLVNMH